MKIEFEGKVHDFPDDFTDADIQAALSNQPQAAQQKSPWALEAPAQAVVDTVSNIPRSAGEFVGNIANAVISPVETIKGLGTIAAGGIDAAARGLESMVTGGNRAQSQPGWENARKAASAVGDFYSGRYGGMRNIGNTIKTDPVGFMADASMLLGVGAGALKAAGMNDAAANTMRVASQINPMNIAIEAAGKTVVPAVKAAYTSVIGTTTGSGKFAVDQAVSGNKQFIDAMRGKITDEKMVDNAIEAVGKLKAERTAAYEQALSGMKNSTTPMDISGIKTTFDGLLKRFGVGKSPDGTLDFSRSRLSDKSAQDIVTAISDDMNTWGSRAGDTTAIGLDTLKGRISNLYTMNGDARLMVAKMAEKVGETIKANVPEYAKMTADYGKATETIKEIEKALSLGRQSSIDTAATKLITAIRKDNDFRRSLLSGLDDRAGTGVVQQAAGRAMSNTWSNRLTSSIAAGGIGAAAYATNPLLGLLLVTASPRVAGELSVVLGRMARFGGKSARTVSPAAVPLEQAGKITAQQ